MIGRRDVEGEGGGGDADGSVGGIEEGGGDEVEEWGAEAGEVLGEEGGAKEVACELEGYDAEAVGAMFV